MKRKIAILLAAAMTLSMLPMNVFAASSNQLNSVGLVIPGDTVMAEGSTDYVHVDISATDVAGLPTGTTSESAFQYYFNNKGISPNRNAAAGTTGASRTIFDPAKNRNVNVYDKQFHVFNSEHDDLSAVVQASELRIFLNENMPSGSQFRVDLENAVYFFRNAEDGIPAVNKATEKYNGGLKAGLPVATGYSSASNNQVLATTYDVRRGTYVPAGQDSTYGEYTRNPNYSGLDSTAYDASVTANFSAADHSGKFKHPASANTYAKEIAYRLKIEQSNQSRAVLYTNENAIGGESVIVIPIVARTTAEKDVKVIIGSSISQVMSNTYLIGVGANSDTNSFFEETVTARDEFPNDRFVIREKRLNSIHSGTIELRLPSGFTWADPMSSRMENGKSVPVKKIVEAGLGNPNEEVLGAQTGSSFSMDYKHTGTRTSEYKLVYDPVTKTGVWKDVVSYTGEIDPSIMVINVGSITPSTKTIGSLVFDGLVVLAEENAKAGDILMELKGGDVCSDQTGIIAGKKADWTILLSTEGTIPTLINGRYDKFNSEFAEDSYHKTAKVVFAENSVNAWWAGRETKFVLPEQVKFRKVDITDIDEMEDVYDTALDEAKIVVENIDGKNVVTGAPIGKYITLDGNTMTWKNMKIKANKKAKIKMDVWVSIETGYEGDVTMGVTGSAIPEQPGEVPTCIIAKQQSPITITTKVSDIKIGYQYQNTADIELTETVAGALLRNKFVNVSVSDLISGDVIITNDTKIAVTAGNMKIKNIAATLGGNAYGNLYGNLNGKGNYVSFQISTPSSEKSTIKLTNVAVKLDRDIPETNYKALQAVAWGSAIAENYGPRNDQFQKPGITADYLNVISAAPDKSNLLAQEVRVTIAEAYFTVNGETKDMDATAYISTASNSTMVPVRFVANAFGFRDDQITWDDDSKTVTIVGGGLVVQFQAGSTTMKVNGADIVMQSPDNLAVKAEITGEQGHERMYIPFRALGNAFGVPVDWDADTQTAIYNKGANKNTLSSKTIAGDLAQ